MTRSKMVKVRVTEAEYADWGLRAKQHGKSLSAFLRQRMAPGIGNPWPPPARPAEGLTEAQRGIDDVIQEIVHETANPYRAKHDEKGRRSEVCIHRMPAHAYCKVCDR